MAWIHSNRCAQCREVHWVGMPCPKAPPTYPNNWTKYSLAADAAETINIARFLGRHRNK